MKNGKHVRTFITQLKSQYSSSVSAPRTKINDFKEQLTNPSYVINKLVTYPNDNFKQYMEFFLKPELIEELNGFKDTSLIVREQSFNLVKDLVEVNRLQHEFFSNLTDLKSDTSDICLIKYSVPRFLLHGPPGAGLSTILAQICLFAGLNKSIIFPFNNAENWLEPVYDLTPSGDYHFNQYKDDSLGSTFDFPSRSADWLRLFLTVNQNLLKELNPTITRSVQWTKKDIMPVGTPWIELINFSLSRPIYSTDCIGILLRETRALSSLPDGPSSFILVDGVNFMWCRGTRLKDKTLQTPVTPNRLAIVHHLTRAMHGDWRKGAIIATTNVRGAWPTDREQYTPGYLLGKAGFNCLNPFIPIHIENYSSTELDVMLRFYAENNWLTNPAAHTPEGRAEIVFLSDSNPLELSRIVSEW